MSTPDLFLISCIYSEFISDLTLPTLSNLLPWTSLFLWERSGELVLRFKSYLSWVIYLYLRLPNSQVIWGPACYLHFWQWVSFACQCIATLTIIPLFGPCEALHFVQITLRKSNCSKSLCLMVSGWSVSTDITDFSYSIFEDQPDCVSKRIMDFGWKRWRTK